MAIEPITRRLLLLGINNSGKSTVVRSCAMSTYDDESRLQFKHQIHNQMIETMKVLITKCQEYYERDPELNANYRFQDNYDQTHTIEIKTDVDEQQDGIKTAAEYILNVDATDTTADAAAALLELYLTRLWGNESIKAMFEERDKISVPASSKYFYDNIVRIMDENYVPTEQDILLLSIPTKQSAERDIMQQQQRFRLMDFGGNIEQRKLWRRVYKSTHIVYCISLISYDEIIPGDDDELEERNGMDESLDCFEETVHYAIFKNTSISLLLTKYDLFCDRIKTKPITIAPCLCEYDGPDDDPEACSNYIQNKIMERHYTWSRIYTYTHLIDCTSDTVVEKIFWDAQKAIVNSTMARGGLI